MYLDNYIYNLFVSLHVASPLHQHVSRYFFHNNLVHVIDREYRYKMHPQLSKPFGMEVFHHNVHELFSQKQKACCGCSIRTDDNIL